MCDRVGVLYAGRLVEEGPATQVFDDPRHPYTVGLLRCLPRGGVRKDQQRLDTIPGFLPQLGADLPGCVFADRCALAQDVCRTEEPPLHRPRRRARTAAATSTSRRTTLPRATPGRGVVPAPVDRSAEPVIRADEPAQDVPPGRPRRPRARRRLARRCAAARRWAWSASRAAARRRSRACCSGSSRPTRAAIIELDGRAARRPRSTKRGARRGARDADRLPEPRLGAQPPLLRAAHPGPRARASCAATRGGEREERLQELARLGAASTTRLIRRRGPAQLSGGLKQRVAIARAFAGEPAARGLRRADLGARRLGAGGDPQPAGRPAAPTKGVTYLFISHDLGVVRYLSDRIAVLYLGRLMELGDGRDGVHARRTIPTPRRCSRGPEGRGRGARRASASRARSRAPPTRRPAASSTPAARATSATSASSRSRRCARSSRATSCAATSRSRSCASCRRLPRRRRTEARRRKREDGAGRRRLARSARGPRATRGVARGHGARAGAARARRGARAPARERRLPLRPERDRRHGRDALPGGARPRGRRRGRGGRRRAWRCAPGTHVALSWTAGVRPLRGVPARAAATSARRPGRRWRRRPARRHDAALARRRAGLPLLASCRRSPSTPSCRRAAASPIPDDVPFDVAALVGCAVTTGIGAVWRTRRRPARRPRRGVRLRRRRALARVLGAAAGGRRPDRGRRRRRRRSSRRRCALGATRRGALGGRRRRRPPRRVRDGHAAAASTTRSRRPGGTEAMRAAFLSTRAARRGGADRDPRAPTRCCTLPALSIPRHGAARARLRSTARRGPSATSRRCSTCTGAAGCRSTGWSSHRLPLDAVEEAFDLLRGGAALRVVLDLKEARVMTRPTLDGRIGEAWSGEVPERQPHQRGARAPRLADRRRGGRRRWPARAPATCRSSSAWRRASSCARPTIVVNKSHDRRRRCSAGSRGARRSSASPRACWTRSPTG